MKTLLKTILVFTVLFLIVKSIILVPADEKIKRKLLLIEEEVKEMGYDTEWIVISEKRGKWYNSILPNSNKKSSHHLSGKAIDIYLFDINDDGKYDIEDVNIIEVANNRVERKNRDLVGAFGTYMNEGYFDKHMIHLDVSGKKRKY
jgi:uncharacterized protein YcbK (DUF882 family)